MEFNASKKTEAKKEVKVLKETTPRKSERLTKGLDKKVPGDQDSETANKKDIRRESTPPRNIQRGVDQNAGDPSGILTVRGGDIDTDSGTSRTPTKETARSDGHIITPQKRQLDYDFWASVSGSVPTKSVRMKTEISELKVADLKTGEFLSDVLKFRVTYKSQHNPKVCTFHGIDETGEIAIVGFGELASTMLNTVEVNKIYTIMDFRVKEESPKYKRGCSSHYEIVLKPSTILKPEETEDNGFTKIPFSFQSLGEIADKSPGTEIDTIAVFVKDWGVRPAGQGKTIRNLSLTDASQETIYATLWGTAAETFSADLYSPVALRKAVVGTSDGKVSLNCYANTLFWINPELDDEVPRLMDWFHEELRKRTTN